MILISAHRVNSEERVYLGTATRGNIHGGTELSGYGWYPGNEYAMNFYDERSAREFLDSNYDELLEADGGVYIELIDFKTIVLEEWSYKRDIPYVKGSSIKRMSF